jgi:hypothetical protein
VSLPALGIARHEVIRTPQEITRWYLTASPAAGSAVVDICKAVDLDAFAAGTTSSMCGTSNRPTLSSERSASGDALGIWDDTRLDVGNVVAWELVSVGGGLEIVTCDLETRRV